MADLNPSEAQRKAMLEKLADHSMWDREGMKLAVDEMIAAANSVPEGAPVDTIARRPDGAWIAVRREKHWGYRRLLGSRGDNPPLPRDADSWPVIYDPTGKTLDELHAEIESSR